MEANRKTKLTVELLEANEWVGEWPADHCNYKWYSKDDLQINLRYYDEYQRFICEKVHVDTVGELKDLFKILYKQKISIKKIK